MPQKKRVHEEEVEMMPMLSLFGGGGWDGKSREFWIDHEIAEDLIQSVVKPIRILNMMEENYRQVEPIHIYLFTPGGDLDVTLAITDTIRSSRIPVHTHNMGRCSSGGFYILCAGHHRDALPSASFMIHELRCGIQGTSSQLRATMREIQQGDKSLLKLLKDKTFINEKDLITIGATDWHMTAEEALEYGVIDEIVPYLDSDDDRIEITEEEFEEVLSLLRGR